MKEFGFFVCFPFPPSFPLTEHTISNSWTQPEDLPTTPVTSTRSSEISRPAEPPLLRPSPPVPFNFILNSFFFFNFNYAFLPRRNVFSLTQMLNCSISSVIQVFCFRVSLRFFFSLYLSSIFASPSFFLLVWN